MDPINRSAKPFCHGERGAMGLSRIPIVRRRCLTAEPKTRSRSRTRKCGAESQGKGFRDLPRNPLSCWARRHRYPDEFSAIEPQDHEAIEEAECKSRNDKQIYGRDVRRMVPKKRRSAAPDHVLGNC